MLHTGNPKCFNLFYILYVFFKMYYVFSFSIQRDKWTFQEMNLTMHKRRIRTAGVQPPSLTLA